MNFEEWDINYHNKKIVNVKKKFTEQELEIIRKLGSDIRDGLYSEYEYECLKMELGKYYKDDDMDKEELEYVIDLENTGVSRDEYNEILSKFDEIDKEYENLFNKITF